MAYQVIARKWRPQTFEEVTGQEVIMRTLRNALEFDRLHHAYLFSGARGVGKTTSARIFAKALNCHKTEEPNLTPCSLDDPTACPSCLEISESRSMDVLEIDAASHTGIGDVRESIIDTINFNPARDRYKVFIIDEVHQLSKPAFNALLKTLEEPPSNVVFIMATTELHKVPETILSRCQEFQFRTIGLQKIFDRLRLIADAEKIDITDEALREIARSGEGSMRDAQSNFDQVISFSGGTIVAEDVTKALGLAGAELLGDTITAIGSGETTSALKVVDSLVSSGHDLRSFCRDLLGLFRDLLVFKIAGNDANLLEGAVFNADQMSAMAGHFTESDISRFFNSISETEARLREAVHPRYVLEMGLVKLIEMRSVASIENILERLDALSSGTEMPPKGQPPVAAAVTEKKTLDSELTTDARPPEPPERFKEEVGEPEPAPSSTIIIEAPQFRVVESPNIRLAPLTSDELEHIDDTRLDDAYEMKLSRAGDDLLPIKGSASLISLLLGRPEIQIVGPEREVYEDRSSNGAATARAFEKAATANNAPIEEPVKLPSLGADPTEGELMKYAREHPAVQSAIRTFRAKIVAVKRA